MTNDEIQQQYTAALSSVKLIDAILLKAQLNASDIARLTNNAEHLDDVVAKDFWTTQNLTVLSTASASAKAAVIAFDKTGTFAQIVSAVNLTAITERDAALAAKTAAQAAHTAAIASAVAAKDAEIARLTALLPAPAPADAEGPTVDDLQIRLAMNAAGLREAVEAGVAASDISVRDWYERAKRFKRHNPMVVALGAALDKTDAELDALWALAATL